MRFFDYILSIDRWLAKRPALLILAILLLIADLLVTLTGLGSSSYSAATIFWNRQPDGQIELFDIDDPRFVQIDDPYTQQAASVIVFQDPLGLLHLSTRSAAVAFDGSLDRAVWPRAREAVIAEFMNEGGSQALAAQLAQGNMERSSIGLWLSLLHFVLWVTAAIIVMSAYIRSAFGRASRSQSNA